MGGPNLCEKIEHRFGGRVRDGGLSHGMQAFLVDPDLVVDLCRFFKDDPELRFDFLSDICGVSSVKIGSSCCNRAGLFIARMSVVEFKLLRFLAMIGGLN